MNKYKYVLEMNEKGRFLIFEQDERGGDIDWFSQEDVKNYKKYNHTNERKEKYDSVFNWIKENYPELII